MSVLYWLTDGFTVLDGSAADRRRRFVESINFSRRWVPSYLIVAAAILTFFILQNLSRKLGLWQRQDKHRQSPFQPCPRLFSDSKSLNSGRSSSSSTLNSNGTQIKDESDRKDSVPNSRSEDGKPHMKHTSDEETPLLEPSPIRRRRILRAWDYIKSVLMYQPAPIPSVTASKNTLPSNGETIFILLLFIPNLFYLLYRAPISIDALVIIADRAGLVVIVNLPILYLLAAKNHPLRWLMGHSYESLNIIHRRLGEWMVLLAVIHGVGLFIIFLPIAFQRGHTLWQILQIPLFTFGILSFLSYLVLYTTSIGYVRERCYEAFLVTHIVGQVGGLVFLYLHFHRCRIYVIATACIWMVDRILMRIFVVPVTVNATANIAADGDTVVLSAKIPLRSKWNLRSSFTIFGGWYPGQHVFISISSLNHAATFQAHPYTIASMPDIIPASPVADEPAYRSLDLIIRAKDGFTKDLLRHIQRTQEENTIAPGETASIDLPLRIDGPYGNTALLDSIKSADRLIFIAGGSGIAVTQPLATFAYRHHATRPVSLTSTSSASSTSSTSPPPTHPAVQHYWILRSLLQNHWLQTPSPLSSFASLPTLLPANGTDAFPRDAVRAELHATLIDDALSSLETPLEPLQNGGRREKVLVVASGPDTLLRDIRNRCSRIVAGNSGILGVGEVEVVCEKFGW